MRRLILAALIALLSVATLSAQNPNIRYMGDAQPGDKVYSCAFNGYADMHTAPTVQAAKIAKFQNGPGGATLIQNLGDWMQVDYNGTVGYVASRMVQDEPTVAYTGSVGPEWVEGIWWSGYGFCIFNNGYWYCGYNYTFEYGYYILQNNEVKLIPVCRLKDADPWNNVWEKIDAPEPIIFEINEAADQLGGVERHSYNCYDYIDGEECGDYPWLHNITEFRSSAKDAAKMVKEHIE